MVFCVKKERKKASKKEIRNPAETIMYPCGIMVFI